jgi:hypothetical protein
MNMNALLPIRTLRGWNGSETSDALDARSPGPVDQFAGYGNRAEAGCGEHEIKSSPSTLGPDVIAALSLLAKMINQRSKLWPSGHEQGFP